MTCQLLIPSSADTESIYMKDMAASVHGKSSVKSGELKHKIPKRHKYVSAERTGLTWLFI